MPPRAPFGGRTMSPELELSNLRGARQSELRGRVAASPGDQRLERLLGMLNEDIETDPFTGAEPRARNQAVSDTLLEANLFQRPEVRAQREEQANIDVLPELFKIQGQQFDRDQQFQNQLALQQQAQGARGDQARLQDELITARQRGLQDPREARQAAALMLTQSRALDKQAKDSGFFGDEDLSGQARALRQRAISMLPGSDPEVFDLVQEAIGSGKTFEDLLDNAGAIGIDPNDTQTLQEIQEAFALFGAQ